jgi:hypothetical protein
MVKLKQNLPFFFKALAKFLLIPEIFTYWCNFSLPLKVLLHMLQTLYAGFSGGQGGVMPTLLSNDWGFMYVVGNCFDVHIVKLLLETIVQIS